MISQPYAAFKHDDDRLSGGDGDPAVAAPGSDEKIAVLSFRAKHGLNLWHPGDRKDYHGWDVPMPQRRLRDE